MVLSLWSLWSWRDPTGLSCYLERMGNHYRDSASSIARSRDSEDVRILGRCLESVVRFYHNSVGGFCDQAESFLSVLILDTLPEIKGSFILRIITS